MAPASLQSVSMLWYAFSVLTLTDGTQEGHLSYKNCSDYPNGSLFIVPGQIWSNFKKDGSLRTRKLCNHKHYCTMPRQK